MVFLKNNAQHSNKKQLINLHNFRFLLNFARRYLQRKISFHRAGNKGTTKCNQGEIQKKQILFPWQQKERQRNETVFVNKWYRDTETYEEQGNFLTCTCRIGCSARVYNCFIITECCDVFDRSRFRKGLARLRKSKFSAISASEWKKDNRVHIYRENSATVLR